MHFKGHVWLSSSFWVCSLNLNIIMWDEKMNQSDSPVVGDIVRTWMAHLIVYLPASWLQNLTKLEDNFENCICLWFTDIRQPGFYHVHLCFGTTMVRNSHFFPFGTWLVSASCHWFSGWMICTAPAIASSWRYLPCLIKTSLKLLFKK